ncbi:lipid A deacylase LpxR family protein [Mucilaginibacter sp. PAMB04168]|uniref:lipid A deacylase LpxR family protein n=1 Tax=Mucilaginibacter sp. PAMB04168 TaxID=3138567 RepID=UPI0031F65148
MKIKLLAICFLLELTANGIFAQNRTHEFGFQSDNDSFLAQGSDRYYTNGLFIFYRRGMDFKNPKLANKVLGIEIGQKMYNPISGSVPDSTYIDRPFAAYLYAGVNVNYLYRDESNLKLSAQIGVVGPSAKGKQVQEIIHNTFGFYELNGWQYQIQNSFQVNLSAEYNRLLFRKDWADISATGYGNLGTTFTGAGIGPLIRLGNFNQLFNSISTQSTATRNSIAQLHKKELFLHYRPQFNYVAYDATVQGALYFESKEQKGTEITSSPNRFVFSNQVGVSFCSSRWIFDAGATFNSKEVKTQTFNSHQWGSLSVIYRFNGYKAKM